MRLIVFAVSLGAVLGLGLGLSSSAYACDVGNYYDPAHEICQPYPPARPQLPEPWQYWDQQSVDRPDLNGVPQP